MKCRVVKAILMSVISSLALTLCMSLAWFTAIRYRTAQNDENNAFNVVKLDAELYFYKGNFSYFANEFHFSGYDSDKTAPELNFSDTNIFCEDELSPANKDTYQFFNVKKTTSIAPFGMEEVFPGNRFLYLIKCKHNFEDKNQVDLTLKNWDCSWNDGIKKINQDLPSGNNEISLSEAIYIYTLNDFTLNSGESFKTKMDASYSDPTLTNKFTEKTASGKNFILNTYTNILGGTNANFYYIPFVIEFSDDPSTFYEFVSATSQVQTFKKPTTPGYGDSNVYSGGVFNGFQMELSVK